MQVISKKSITVLNHVPTLTWFCLITDTAVQIAVSCLTDVKSTLKVSERLAEVALNKTTEV